MKNILALIVFVALLVSSCTKVIDIKLNENDAQYVIEGFVTLGETTHEISITKTLNISESSSFPVVDNAIVTLSDDLGNSQTMTSIGNGKYQVNSFPVTEGTTYTLSVSIDGNIIVATES